MRYVGTLVLFTLAVTEQTAPGWNGWFTAASTVSEDATRIVSAIYLSAGVVLFCLPLQRSGSDD